MSERTSELVVMMGDFRLHDKRFLRTLFILFLR